MDVSSLSGDFFSPLGAASYVQSAAFIPPQSLLLLLLQAAQRYSEDILPPR